jgi:hypothetical protein
LEDQHGVVQTLLNSMADYTATGIAEIYTVTELIRNNARKLIRSTIANQQSQEEPTPSVAASSDRAARHIDFTQKPQADEGVIHLNVNGIQWPPLAGGKREGGMFSLTVTYSSANPCTSRPLDYTKNWTIKRD